jgi:hypothetical protein
MPTFSPNDAATPARAQRARRAWTDPLAKASALERLNRRVNDPTTDIWQAILAHQHPIADWLDGNADLSQLPLFFGDVSVHQIFASCPLEGRAPWKPTWSDPTTSPTS